MASCQRCRTRAAVPGFIFCSWCAQHGTPLHRNEWPRQAEPLPPDVRVEDATAFTRNGMTYASINGREVAPDILVTHASVAPAIAAELLARLRSERATEWQPMESDLEWDPDD